MLYYIFVDPFYYGEFEYPTKSGQWYKGVHEPIVTKELFEMVKESMHVERNFRYRSKEFAFTRLMKCGRCGSGVTAQEKYKKLKDGTTARYVYYGCTRSKDYKCPVEYIREEELLTQILGIIDRVGIDELGLRKRLGTELERYYQFQTMLGTAQQEITKTDVDMRNYAKYVLRTGSSVEKRELLAHLRGRLILQDKIVQLG